MVDATDITQTEVLNQETWRNCPGFCKHLGEVLAGRSEISLKRWHLRELKTKWGVSQVPGWGRCVKGTRHRKPVDGAAQGQETRVAGE